MAPAQLYALVVEEVGSAEDRFTLILALQAIEDILDSDETTLRRRLREVFEPLREGDKALGALQEWERLS